MKLFYDSSFRSLSEAISQYRVDIRAGLTLFTIHLWLPNFPCLIFLFQLADDRNFIHHLEPLWPEPSHFVPPKYSPASFLGLLPFPFSHHRIGSRLSSRIFSELREGQTCVLLGSGDFGWLLWFSGAGPASSQQLSVKTGRYREAEMSEADSPQVLSWGRSFYDSRAQANTNTGITHFIYLGLQNSTHKHAG